MYEITTNNNKYSVALKKKRQPFLVNNVPFSAEIKKILKQKYRVVSNHKAHIVYLLSVDLKEKKISVLIGGRTYVLKGRDKYDLLLSKISGSSLGKSKEKTLKAPMPGLVVSVLAKERALVKKDDSLLILEAMKMENILKSNVNASIKKILVKKGDVIEKGQPLFLFN